MYALREAVNAFRRAPVLTGLSSAMVGLALFVVGLFGLATYNLQLALTAIEERVEISVHLRDDARQSEIDLAHRELAEIPEVRSVTFLSKRDALERARGDRVWQMLLELCLRNGFPGVLHESCGDPVFCPGAPAVCQSASSGNSTICDARWSRSVSRWPCVGELRRYRYPTR